MFKIGDIEYYSRQELIENFGIDKQTFAEHIKSGRLKGYKVARKYFFTQEQVNNWIATQSIDKVEEQEAPKKNEGEQEVTATSQVSQVSRHNQISNTVEIDFNILLSAVQEEHISQVMERINQMQDEADLLKVSTIEWLLNHAKAECKEPLKDYLYSARAEMEKGNKIECVS